MTAEVLIPLGLAVLVRPLGEVADEHVDLLPVRCEARISLASDVGLLEVDDVAGVLDDLQPGVAATARRTGGRSRAARCGHAAPQTTSEGVLTPRSSVGNATVHIHGFHVRRAVISRL